MNHIIYPIIGTVLLVGGFVLGRTTSPQPQQTFSGIQEDLDLVRQQKAVAIRDFIINCERLKGDTCVPDIDFGTTEEISQGYADAVNFLEVQLNGNENFNAIQNKMRTKLGEQSKLCNDPNSTSQGTKDTRLVTPI